VTTYTLDVTGATPGNFVASAWNGAGFTSPQGTTVFTDSGRNYIRTNPNDYHMVAYTTATALDGECRTYFGTGVMHLRITADRALYYRDNGAGTIRIGVVTGFDKNAVVDPDSTFTRTDLYVSTNADVDLPGHAALDGDSVITFGAVGFEIYVEYDGVEVLRFKQWTHVVAGNIGVAVQSGARDIVVDMPGDTALYSDPTNDVYDPRDFGLRELDACTGSISASSSTLVLSANPGFEIGDHIIVEIGTESGLGVRGTDGVGGHWPPLDYADKATMDLDVGKPNGTWAAALDTGFVYTSSGGVWTRNTAGGGAQNQGYYSCFIVPKSLVAVVTNVSGTTLTLDTPASATATNANVWLDCLPAFYVLDPTVGGRTPGLEAGSAPDGIGAPYLLLPPNDGVVFEIPAGRYATSDRMSCGSEFYNFPNLIFRGQGTGQTHFFAPDGTMGAQWAFFYCTGMVIKDFSNIANHGANGYGFDAGTNAGGASSNVGIIYLDLCDDCEMRNIRFAETFNAGILSRCEEGWIYDCHSTLTETHEAYVGWTFQTANETGGGFQDCTVTSPYLVKAFEVGFASADTNAIRCGGQNALLAANSSNGWIFEGCHSIITAGSWQNAFFGLNEAVFNINSNAFGGSGRQARGVVNCRVVQEDYIDGTNSLPHIGIDASYALIPITGEYPRCPVADNHGGYFEAPDWDPSSVTGGSVILSTGSDIVISGIRIVGAAKTVGTWSGPYAKNISLQAGGSVSNCVVDTIQSGPTLSGNISNEIYETTVCAPGPRRNITG
jgi:hypothetical protein